MTKIPTNPLARIAIALSGGGYRAAAFHLGTFDYLQSVTYQGEPLMHKVKVMSTVSGGTICGALYAVMLKEGSSFEDFYNRLSYLMRDFDLIEAGLKMINQEDTWPSHKRRNMINAFAQIYDNEFYKGATFDMFVDLKDDKMHLEEVIFNATEFKNGLYFRFQNEGRCGNQFIQLTKGEMRELKIGDIVAASSCFPSGFEPLAFPHDFTYEGAKNLAIKCKYEDFQDGPVGLMDGGIVDNQGIYSVILAENRRSNQLMRKVGNADEDTLAPTEALTEKQLDLIFVSDVSSPYMEQLDFAQPQPSPFLRKLNLGRLNLWLKGIQRVFILTQVLFFIVLAVFILSWIGVLEGLLGKWADDVLSISGLMCGLLLVPILGYWFVKKKIRTELNLTQKGRKDYNPKTDYTLMDLVPDFYRKYVPHFTSLNFEVLKPMGEDRYTSVMSMVGDVFMKQVRRLIYDRLYLDTGWDHRRIANFIYELRAEDLSKRSNILLLPDDLQDVGDKISDAATKASSMGTTLWFTEEEKEAGMIEHLIACGQFATCYNLLEYLWLLKGQPDYHQLDAQQQRDLDNLWKIMLEDWRRFKNDPFFLLKEREKAKL
ncbi:MAG: patatin-like phospholipase family protein [Saprospiraceae bacterium]